MRINELQVYIWYGTKAYIFIMIKVVISFYK